MTEFRTRAYTSGKLSDEDFALDLVSEHLDNDDTIVWVDFENPSKDELATLSDELGLHELAVEDAVEPHQRPKVDFYGKQIFISTHMVRIDVESGELIEHEVDAFVGRRFLITVRPDAHVDM